MRSCRILLAYAACALVARAENRLGESRVMMSKHTKEVIEVPDVKNPVIVTGWENNMVPSFSMHILVNPTQKVKPPPGLTNVMIEQATNSRETVYQVASRYMLNLFNGNRVDSCRTRESGGKDCPEGYVKIGLLRQNTSGEKETRRKSRESSNDRSERTTTTTTKRKGKTQGSDGESSSSSSSSSSNTNSSRVVSVNREKKNNLTDDAEEEADNKQMSSNFI